MAKVQLTFDRIERSHKIYKHLPHQPSSTVGIHVAVNSDQAHFAIWIYIIFAAFRMPVHQYVMTVAGQCICENTTVLKAKPGIVCISHQFHFYRWCLFSIGGIHVLYSIINTLRGHIRACPYYRERNDRSPGETNPHRPVSCRQLRTVMKLISSGIFEFILTLKTDRGVNFQPGS